MEIKIGQDIHSVQADSHGARTRYWHDELGYIGSFYPGLIKGGSFKTHGGYKGERGEFDVVGGRKKVVTACVKFALENMTAAERPKVEEAIARRREWRKISYKQARDFQIGHYGKPLPGYEAEALA